MLCFHHSAHPRATFIPIPSQATLIAPGNLFPLQFALFDSNLPNNDHNKAQDEVPPPPSVLLYQPLLSLQYKYSVQTFGALNVFLSAC